LNYSIRYHPFGTEMSNRSFSSPSYRYGFNGMEKDDEVKGIGNSYDFGARLYDSRLGKFLTIDKFYDKAPTYSSYTFSQDSPIIFIDHNGQYTMSKRMQRKYPELTNMLKNIQQTVHDDPQTWEAFKNTLGLTDQQADEILKWGTGPKIKVGWTIGAFASTSSETGNIKLSRREIKRLEGKRKSPHTRDGQVFLVYATVLHEGQHSAEALYGVSLSSTYDKLDPNSEAGLVFERKAFGGLMSINLKDNPQAVPESVKPFAIDIDEIAQKYNDRINSGPVEMYTIPIKVDPTDPNSRTVEIILPKPKIRLNLSDKLEIYSRGKRK
jgi:RHS repeat-associated protein